MRQFFLCFMLLTTSLSAQQTTVEQLFQAVKAEIRELGSRKAAYDEYQNFVDRHGLQNLSYWEFLKNKVAFECCRDAGLWHIGYQITDREPNSQNIWAQWKAHRSGLKLPTALAECDELSALYAVVAGRLGVTHIGLFWPTSNHTVAVWKLEGKRIVVPTTPIFLERYDGFDAQGFDPQTQTTIYDYTAQDVGSGHPLPPGLVKFFARQVRDYGGASQELLHELRYLREAVWLGRAQALDFERLSRRFTKPEDRRALKAFSRQFSRHLRN